MFECQPLSYQLITQVESVRFVSFFFNVSDVELFFKTGLKNVETESKDYIFFLI